MITKGAHHIGLTVSDLEEAERFYGGLLGLPRIERPDMGLAGAWYQAGAVQLHLIVPPPQVEVGTLPGTLNPIANHIAFEIDDFEAVKRRLEEAGHEVLSLGVKNGQMFVRDPHGNVVEFNHPGPA